FKNVTGVSDSLLKTMSPYFKFPNWAKKDSMKPSRRVKNKAIETKDLNMVSAEDLIKISGIGGTLSERIIKYRTRLQGFTYKEQLYEVYGLNTDLADDIIKAYPINTPPKIIKK